MKTKTSLRAGAGLGALMTFGAFGAAHAQDTTTAWKGAPQWTNDDVQFKVRENDVFEKALGYVQEYY